MRKVYDCKDIRRLSDSDIGERISRGIVITATSALTDAMRDFYPDYHVYDIHSLISGLIPEWDEDVKDIKNYVILRNVIEEYVVDHEVNANDAIYLRRNASEIWNAIKLLVEADVYPQDIPEGSTGPIKHFKQIWRKLETDNTQIIAFRGKLSYKELSDRETVRKELISILGQGCSRNLQEFFLLGFYFITPIQERIFDILSKCGFELSYLNLNNPDYGYANDIWKRTFEAEYSSGSAIDIQSDLRHINLFGEALSSKDVNINIDLIKDPDDFTFAKTVKEAIDKGERVYSPDAKGCERILKEFYPEYYDRKHLLSYPVGQYIYYLHKMWDTYHNQRDLKHEYIVHCFASGWLAVDTLNGKDYVYEIKMLGPFFKGCKDIPDWYEQIDALKHAKDLTRYFDEREKGKERWHKLMGNPFMNIGVYTIDDETLDAIILLLKKLISDAERLFPGEDRTNLYEHFRRVAEIIESRIDDGELYEEEAEIVNDLLKQLSDESTKEITCPMNGIRDALVLLIGDHFGDDESQEAETSDKRRMVQPLSMIEAEMLNDHEKKIKLVMADEFTLPGAPKKLPWPLNEKFLETLNIKSRADTVRYVNAMQSVIDNRPLSYRYLFYTFIGLLNEEGSNLAIEWICKKEKKEVDITPYARIITQIETNVESSSDEIKELERLIYTELPDPTEHTVLMPDTSLPEEVKMDYLICKQRYLYSYLLNQSPTFTSKFHYSFVLSSLISAFSEVANVDKKKVADNIYDLLPFFNTIEKKQSTDFAKNGSKTDSHTDNSDKPKTFEYEAIGYPPQRLLVHYINRKLLEVGRVRLDKFMKEQAIDETIPEGACIYCPYSEVCFSRYEEQVAGDE